MSINLLDMLKDQVTGSLAKEASNFLGESESNVTSALGGAFPALMGSLISKSSEPEGASGIMDMIGGLDMGMLGDIGGLFGGGASSVNGLLGSGGGILESLLGDKLGGVVDLISKVSGLKSGSSSSLIKMAAPFLIGMIGKQIKGKGIGFLTDLLMGQKDHVSKALPSGMGDLLGLGFASGAMDKISETVKDVAGAGASLASNAASSAGAATTAATGAVSGAAKAVANSGKEAASTGLSWLKWALPILAIAALAWYFMTGKNPAKGAVDATKEAAGAVGDATKNAAGAVGDATKNMADAVSDMAKSAFATVDEAAKSALDKVTFAANSAGQQMMDFINGGFKGDAKVRFNNLTFATGSAKIDGESAQEIDNLASILKAYPGVKIAINGYTDNTGDADMNKKLSSARASAVMARLVGQGIAMDRMSATGHGDDNPVASNDTEEGRAQNRRIEVEIVK